MEVSDYVYATLLPTGVIKIGKGTGARATSAQTFFHEQVVVLKKWPTNDLGVSETAAHNACKAYKLNGGGFELFRAKPDEIIKCIEEGFEKNKAVDFFMDILPGHRDNASPELIAFVNILGFERWGEDTNYSGTYSEKHLKGFYYPYHLFKKNRALIKKSIAPDDFDYIIKVIRAAKHAIREIREITSWFDTWEVGPRRPAGWWFESRYQRNYFHVLKVYAHSERMNDTLPLISETLYGMHHSSIVQRLHYFTLGDRLRVYKWWKRHVLTTPKGERKWLERRK